MGIPNYFMHIVREYRDIIKKLSNHSFVFDNLYLDCNSIIYESVHELPYDKNTTNYEAKLIEMTCQKIKEHIGVIRPRNRVIVAFDGVAPVAKMNQQRERRYRSWFQSQVIKDVDEKVNYPKPF